MALVCIDGAIWRRRIARWAKGADRVPHQRRLFENFFSSPRLVWVSMYGPANASHCVEVCHACVFLYLWVAISMLYVSISPSLSISVLTLEKGNFGA